jgi:dTDP-4-amino-4,6-dideoxygalactose transaminase
VIGRRQLAATSAISPVSLARAFAASLGSAQAAEARAKEVLERDFRATRAVLTDSGTSALVIALRLAAPNGGVVGFPGYACVDLAAAARRAGVRVRLYDLDPETLSPDLESVRQLLGRGVDAIVVAPLFGYPADVPAVRALASEAGVAVIEDAAQGAGGTLGDRRLGSLSDLSVLSFGRGKGLCAGGGGALLGSGDRWLARMSELELASNGRGWSGLAKTGVQWALGRPSVYALPSMLPWLHLGEMVYHPAGEPSAMATASSALLLSALDLEPSDLALRRAHAALLSETAMHARALAEIAPIAGAWPGYLRYAVRDLGGAQRAQPALGIMQPYPRTLAEQQELRPVLMDREPPTDGATEIRRTLYTLPTHRFVTRRDLALLATWMSGSGAGGGERGR